MVLASSKMLLLLTMKLENTSSVCTILAVRRLFYTTMELREGEYILKVFHHHPTPFIFTVLKIIGATLPFFFLLFLFQESMPLSFLVWGHVIILGIFALVITYYSLVYWLDKLIITSMRVIYIDWKFLTVRDEAEAALDDIQDIQTSEKGFLSYFKFFDYGLLRLDTASSYVTLEFLQAPDPEGIRQYIYHVRRQ